MFAIEQSSNYDPSKPTILDGRPQSVNSFGQQSPLRPSEALRKENMAPVHSSPAQHTSKPSHDDSSMTSNKVVSPLSPSRLNSSPAKSSLSKKTGADFRRSGFDPETGIWEDEDDIQHKQLPAGRGLHRHHKSVTFDQAPPQINEYEEPTPAPSSIASESRQGSYEDDDDEDEDLSFERGSSMDHDDSFDASLEDTEKTPVVLPEDWRFMSPEIANTDLMQGEEDVFDDDCGSPAPTAQPGALAYRPHQTSAGSVDSNGQNRPLPPLPPTLGHNNSPSKRLSGAFERMSIGQRSLPTPPMAAAISKADIQKIGTSSSLTGDDRLRLMALQEQDRERRMRRLGSKEPSPVRAESVEHSEPVLEEPGPEIVEYSDSRESRDVTPQISRASVLQGLRGDLSRDSRESSDDTGTHMASSTRFDPDVAIPSMEDPTQTHIRDAYVKEEDQDEPDLYSIPDAYNSRIVSDSEQSANQEDDDLTSQYSQYSQPSVTAAPASMPVHEDGQETPKAQSPKTMTNSRFMVAERVSLPEFADFGGGSDFNIGLTPYLSQKEEKPMPPIPAVSSTALPDLAALRQSIQRSYTPDLQLKTQQLPAVHSFKQPSPGTPESIVRHSVDVKDFGHRTDVGETSELSKFESDSDRSISPSDSGSVIVNTKEGSPVSPISAEFPNSSHNTGNVSSGSEFQKAAEEKTPAHLQIPANAGKRVSSLVPLEIAHEELDDGLGLGLEKEFDRVVEAQKVEFELSLQRLYYPFNGRFPSNDFAESRDMRIADPLENVPHLPKPRGARFLPQNVSAHRSNRPYTLDEDSFANRTPQRQRGYLMRQNTKIVVASERVSQDECRSPTLPTDEESNPLTAQSPNANLVQPSPRKISQPTWTAEPWNGKVRRKSIRVGGEKAVSHRKPIGGSVPPLPGQASNVQESLDAVAEDELGEEDEWEDGAERGRLFVKVVGVKDLQMPFPQRKDHSHETSSIDQPVADEKTYFALTLDNGLHCVTTAWLELGRSAPIGQEFELVVLNDLEFQLTLQMKLEEPKIERPQSPSKPPTSPKKQGAFGRLFGSPKKRKESELRAQQEVQSVRRPVTPPSAYELVQGLVAKDGSFARAYVALSEHEKHTFGRPYNVDITCFNEWALEQVHLGSSRSKKGVTQLQRRPPHEIGKLELQLLYVPKPRGAKDEDMPKSMNGAIRALREAEERVQQQANIKGFEGYLSQQGGDCPVGSVLEIIWNKANGKQYWRRRFFKLAGPKLTAYHETTLQPRATINLAKASRLIDDKSSLTQKETSTKGGGRRKSGFAEEEEGYMFVEEGFRIRFANGEVIDFYADSPAAKDEWMQALAQVVGKGVQSSSAPAKGWIEMVLKREKKSKTEGSSSAHPSRPHGHQRTETYHAVGALSQHNSPVKTKTDREERHRKTKSLHAF